MLFFLLPYSNCIYLSPSQKYQVLSQWHVLFSMFKTLFCLLFIRLSPTLGLNLYDTTSRDKLFLIIDSKVALPVLPPLITCIAFLSHLLQFVIICVYLFIFCLPNYTVSLWGQGAYIPSITKYQVPSLCLASA